MRHDFWRCSAGVRICELMNGVNNYPPDRAWRLTCPEGVGRFDANRLLTKSPWVRSPPIAPPC